MVKLNAFLQPENAPVTQPRAETGYQFDTTSDRGMVRAVQIQDASITNAKIGTAAIGTANIGTLTFNEISGGTATLGGTSNGNGLLTVNNAAGTEVVKIDNTGIAINNGSLSIKNDTGVVFLDSKGIVGTASFDSGGTFNSSSRSVGTNVYTDVSNTEISFVLGRTQKVLIGVGAQVHMADMEGDSITSYFISLNLDGVNQSPDMTIRDTRLETPAVFSTDSRTYTISRTSIETLALGTHTLKLQHNISDTDDSGVIENTSLYYVVLGN